MIVTTFYLNSFLNSDFSYSSFYCSFLCIACLPLLSLLHPSSIFFYYPFPLLSCSFLHFFLLFFHTFHFSLIFLYFSSFYLVFQSFLKVSFSCIFLLSFPPLSQLSLPSVPPYLSFIFTFSSFLFLSLSYSSSPFTLSLLPLLHFHPSAFPLYFQVFFLLLLPSCKIFLFIILSCSTFLFFPPNLYLSFHSPAPNRGKKRKQQMSSFDQELTRTDRKSVKKFRSGPSFHERREAFEKTNPGKKFNPKKKKK